MIETKKVWKFFNYLYTLTLLKMCVIVIFGEECWRNIGGVGG
jgi:hypothetical protein